MNAKPLFQSLFLVVFSTFLLACSSTKIIGYGRIESIKQVQKVDYVPRTTTLKSTVVGAGVGAGTGAALGALVGGVAGTGLTIMTFGLALPLLPGFIVGGTATGAGIGAGTGAGVGAGAGYISEIHGQGKGLYKIAVKMEGKKDNLLIFQNINKLISVNSRVQIIFRNNQLLIKE